MKKSLILLSLAAVLMAADNTGEFKTHTELSYIKTGGNTDTQSLGLDFHGEKSWQPHKLSLDFEAFYAENDGDVNKNVWKTELNYYYIFSDDIEFNYLVGYKQDQFSGYDYQFYTGPGMLYRVMQRDPHKLSVYGNILYSIDKIENGDTDSYASWLAGFDYEYKFNENVKFKEEANIRSQFSDFENYFVYSKTSVYSKMTENLSLGVSYKIDYKNQPPAGKKNTDTTLMVSLVVDW